MSKPKKNTTASKQSGSPASTKSEQPSSTEPTSNDSQPTSQTEPQTGGDGDVTVTTDSTGVGVNVQGEGDDLTQTAQPDGNTGQGSTPPGGADGDGEPQEDPNTSDEPKQGTGMDEINVMGRNAPGVDPIETPATTASYPDIASQQVPVDSYTEKRKDLWEPLPDTCAPVGRILRGDDEVEFDGEKVGNMIIVKENVYREVFARGAKTPNYVLLYRKGTLVHANTMQQADAYVG